MSALSTISIQTIDSKLHQWEQTALSKGLTTSEIKQQNSFIRTELQKWIGNWAEESRNKYVKKSAEGPVRTVEFLVNGTQVTVITHCKQKGGQSLMGSGFQSVVKTSIVTLTIDLFNQQPKLQSSTLIADKVPKKGKSFEQNKKALEREGQFISQLSDAKYIRQLVAGVENRDNKPGILLIAMQTTLKNFLGSTFGLDNNKKISISKDLISGLKEMRAKNIVHRDLHTDNCALSYDNRWLIHDFGFAQYEGQKIPVGSSLNISTSSPRILEDRVMNRESTARSVDDAWALGLILYEIDTGRKPDFYIQLIAICNALEKQDQTALQTAYDKYVTAVDEFIVKLKKSDLFLHEVVLDLINGEDLDSCLECVVDLEEDEEEVEEVVKPSESTEDLTNAFEGYQTTEQLNELFP